MIAIFSNFTAESTAKRVETARGTKVHTPAGFDTWAQELIDFENDAEFIFIILHAPALFAGGVGVDFAAKLSPLVQIIEGAKNAHKDKIFIVSTLDFSQNCVMPLVAQRFECEAMAFWRREIEKLELPIFELAEMAQNMGREKFYSAKMWFAGGLPFSLSGEKQVAAEILRIVDVLTVPRKKCAVLDLDDTLWCGVVGEEEIEIAQFGMGAQYREFQRGVLNLRKMGALLAVVSKNNFDDAMKPFRENPHMLLHEDDFAAFIANWEPKSENIKALAKTLNIGLDSFVFIDDNPIERASVASALPQVAVPDFPADSSELPKFAQELAHRYFQRARETREDARKTAMYAEEASRESTKSAFSTLDEYLESLEMTLEIRPLAEADIPRAAQLTQKTNQFNLTTKRYTEGDITRFCASPGWRVWMGSLSDRFGDYGNIVLCIANLRGDRAIIDTFLMSCRAMGRKVEEKTLRHIEHELFGMGVSKIEAQFIETPKNAPAKNFLPKIGYTESGGIFWKCLQMTI